MTQEEFILNMKNRGASFALPANEKQISLANISLQQIQAAMLPVFLINLYKKTGGINLGCAYIFGPQEISNGNRSPVPDIFSINKEISNINRMRGKTVFGRNDLFWFAFDSFGTCLMLDNATLNILRTYEDPYKSLTDCLVAGKN